MNKVNGLDVHEVAGIFYVTENEKVANQLDDLLEEFQETSEEISDKIKYSDLALEIINSNLEVVIPVEYNSTVSKYQIAEYYIKNYIEENELEGIETYSEKYSLPL